MKPSGTIGPMQISASPDGVVAEQLKVLWPTDQKEIERKVLGYFKRELEKQGGKILSIEDGGTTELDFLIETPQGKAWLELMEVVVPRDKNPPFQSGNHRHTALGYADTIWQNVEKKILKYGLKHTVPIDLLLYVTHEQYAPWPAAIYILMHYFKDRPHCFKNVIFIVPTTEDHTPTYVLFALGSPAQDLPPLDELKKNFRIIMPVSSGTVTVTRSDAKQ